MAAPRRANGRISWWHAIGNAQCRWHAIGNAQCRWHAIGNAQWWRGGSGGPRHRDRVPSTVQSVAVMVGRATGNEGRRGTFARARSRYPVESVVHVDGSSGCLRVGHTRMIQSSECRTRRNLLILVWREGARAACVRGVRRRVLVRSRKFLTDRNRTSI
jgi:hypothetical protein